jgi:hypothetical protein
MGWTRPRACAQLLDCGINRRLVYPSPAERLEYLTFSEECGEDAARERTRVSTRRGRADGPLRIGEYDVRCAEGPACQVGVKVGARGKNAPCKRVIEPASVG